MRVNNTDLWLAARVHDNQIRPSADPCISNIVDYFLLYSLLYVGRGLLWHLLFKF
jgi:hypothetical protein